MSAANTNPEKEPRNPFYFLLLLASLLFVMTALAYAVVPVLEQARELPPPTSSLPAPSSLHRALKEDGGSWLLYEVATMFLFGILSMALDRLRTLKKVRKESSSQKEGSQ